MTKMMGLGLALALMVALMVGCAKPQTIFIETTPSGAAISLDSEYYGRSPATIKLDNVKKLQTLIVVAEMGEYNAATKTIRKKSNGMFPKQIFLKLDRTYNPNGSGGPGSHQTTIQGPTIVIPGVGAAPPQ